MLNSNVLLYIVNFPAASTQFPTSSVSPPVYGKNKGQGFLTVYEEMSSRQIRETRASEPERDLNLGTPN